MLERRRVIVNGIVQGVGFRPFVYGLAHRYGLVGLVRNDPAGVTIEVEGHPPSVAAFVQSVREEAPPLAYIERIISEPLPVTGDTAFVIDSSQGDAETETFVSPDVAVCDDCLRELLDPTNRRYYYPFINCTNCGPRFTIIQDMPYDRPWTTMALFPMCLDCQAEYNDPHNRRFHAQPNACPTCGPQLRLLGGRTKIDDMVGVNAVMGAQWLLGQGAILAIKGLGGYHLACDATNSEAVNRLRALKHREDKPFALMAADLSTIQRYCHVSDAEWVVLTSRQRPIVVLNQRPLNRGWRPPIADQVAPGHRTLGFMLPYTPLHYLLFAPNQETEQTPTVLVMTSGNISDEPIMFHDEEAIERLAGIADAFLIHDRDIYIRCDDSVVRLVQPSASPEEDLINILFGQQKPAAYVTTLQFLRRSRGYAPLPIALPFETSQPILAVGGQLKNTFCLAKGKHAVISHHIGDLDTLETLTSFQTGITHYSRLFDIHPTVIAHDLHPDYAATRYALDDKDGADMIRVGVQHHHAHIASVLAEHGLERPVIGVALDGTGYGLDGRVWGGEFMIADLVNFERLAHLAYLPLPGGEAAIRQPWRVAAAYLQQTYGDAWLELNLPFVQRINRSQWRTLRQMMTQGLNSPLTSSMGRLFDAVASLLGVRDTIHYEGQAAVELELLADEDEVGSYTFMVEVASEALFPPAYPSDVKTPRQVDVQPVIRAVVDDLLRGVDKGIVAARFHHAVAALIVEVCEETRTEYGLSQVALSGGVFQNAFLLTRTLTRLTDQGFEVYLNEKVPANDGGLAFGQVAVAAAKLRNGR